ncbi:MAG: sulfatase-like hydrolase/transferase [Actinomycetota bacterium]|nr:sulfatase-like hydrolase/transferase [Actinomycetota bacterium]
MALSVRGLFSVGIALLSLASPALAEAQRAPERPSIVLVLTDDQRWDTLSPDVLPTVERELVARGVSFRNAFVPNPLCCPSRASILTGKYSHSTGVYTNRAPHGGVRAFDASSTIATWLHRAGYRTALVGKYLNQYRGTAVPPGWDYWNVFAGRPGYYDYSLSYADRRGEAPVILEHGSDPGDYSTDVLGDDAASFIRSTTGPLFLFYAPFAPHTAAGAGMAIPAPRHVGALAGRPAPRWAPSYNESDVADKPAYIRSLPFRTDENVDRFRQAQLESLLAVDDAVAEIIAALRQSGRLRNTIIAFTSDNGFLWGEHRWMGKIVPYDESIRVPLVVRYDALTSTPASDGHLVLNVDLAETFAELARTSAPGAEGRSLLPLLRRDRVRWRRNFVLESMQEPVPAYCGVRSRRYAYVEYRTGEEELYELVRDPLQLESRARDGDRRKMVVELRLRTRALCDPPPPGLRLLSPCLLQGDARANTLYGTNFYDYVCGRGGADTIYARRGDDAVFAGRGNDLVYGGGGDDLLRAGPGRDRLLGGPGDDRLRAKDGVGGNDVLVGGRGSDVCIADRGDVKIGCP